MDRSCALVVSRSIQLLLLPSFLGVLSNGTHLQYAAINSAVDLYDLVMVWVHSKLVIRIVWYKGVFRKLMSSILLWTIKTGNYKNVLICCLQKNMFSSLFPFPFISSYFVPITILVAILKLYLHEKVERLFFWIFRDSWRYLLKTRFSNNFLETVKLTFDKCIILVGHW